VETAEQETFLREHACDEMQGFLFSRAVSAEEIAQLFQSVPSPPLQPIGQGVDRDEMTTLTFR
jgi:sensor c-di-GMP phosphodiesterase-like protein